MDNIEALLFDVFGTVVDWRSTVIREVKELGEKHKAGPTDWGQFAQEWRQGYLQNTRAIAAGGSGSLNVDRMHREILDSMLSSPKWEHLSALWSEEERQRLNLVWHRLDGWPDATDGLYQLKGQKIIATLSNGNVRLLVDMAKNANLPWDTIFSTELFSTFKPNPKAYLEAMRHLDLPPEKCAMVAAHIYDLRAAAKQGMATIYVERPQEDLGGVGEVKAKKDGGEVDCVVSSFLELATIFAKI